MGESRRFIRVQFSARCDVSYEGVTYHARTHNLSTNGAMIGFDDSVMIPETEECLLDVHIQEGQPPLHLRAEVVYSSYFTMGVKFTGADEATRTRLNSFVDALVQSGTYPLS